MTKRGSERPAVGTIGDIGGDRAKNPDWHAGTWVRTGEELHAIEALQLYHAPQEPGLDVHDAVRIGEIPRQCGKGPIDFAGPEPKITPFQRHIVRTRRRLPQGFTSVHV